MSILSLEEETRKLFVKKPGLKMQAEAGGRPQAWIHKAYKEASVAGPRCTR